MKKNQKGISPLPVAGSDPVYLGYHDNEWGTPFTTTKSFRNAHS